ncbi:MAG: hypothetical protein RR322_03695, partial [Oscillospiraceae bacterium]
RSIVTGQGRDFSVAKSFIDDYTKDGLVPATEAITAYKNLASRGYSDPQIQQTMTALKDSASFGRQGSLSMGQAIAGASEGLKNENSMLVDNAGVTKNVSMMWKEYASSIGVSADSLTKQQKIQAEVSGIMKETQFQTGDAQKVASTYSGQMMSLGFVFNNLKIAVGNFIKPIVTAVIPILSSAISFVTKFVNILGQVASDLFGVQFGGAEETGKQAQAIGQSVENEKALAKETKKTNKEAKKQLANFDDISLLEAPKSEDSDSADMGGAGGFEMPPFNQDVNLETKDVTPPSFTAGLKSKAQEYGKLFTPAVNAWKDSFAGVAENIKPAFEKIKNSGADLLENGIKPLGSFLLTDFIPSMHNGFAETFAPIFQDVASFAVKEFAKNVEFACNVVKNIINDVLIPIFKTIQNVILGIFDGIKKAWDKYGKSILDQMSIALDGIRSLWNNLYNNCIKPIFDKIFEVINKLWNEHLKPLWDKLTDFIGKVVEKLLMVWNNVLKPIVDWLVSFFGPIVSGIFGFVADIIGGVVGFIVDIIGGVIDVLSWVIDFLVNVFTGNWAGCWDMIKNLVSGAWDGIVNIFSGAWQWFYDNVISPITNFFSDAWNAIVNDCQQCWNMICSIFGMLWTWFDDNVISPIANLFSNVWDKISSDCQRCWDMICAIFGMLWNWFDEHVISPVVNCFKNAWDGIINDCKHCWDLICGVFKMAWNWFNDNVVSPIVSCFQNVWDKVQYGANMLWWGIQVGVLSMVNFVIETINNMISGLLTPINFVIGALNHIPNVNIPLLEFSIPTFTLPPMPQLATGAVIPPNKQFMAILGDQKNGTNIETPLSTMVEAFKTALSTTPLSGSKSSPTTIVLELDGREFGRVLMPIIEGENRRIGTKIIKAGGY